MDFSQHTRSQPGNALAEASPDPGADEQVRHSHRAVGRTVAHRSVGVDDSPRSALSVATRTVLVNRQQLTDLTGEKDITMGMLRILEDGAKEIIVLTTEGLRGRLANEWVQAPWVGFQPEPTAEVFWRVAENLRESTRVAMLPSERIRLAAAAATYRRKPCLEELAEHLGHSRIASASPLQRVAPVASWNVRVALGLLALAVGGGLTMTLLTV